MKRFHTLSCLVVATLALAGMKLGHGFASTVTSASARTQADDSPHNCNPTLLSPPGLSCTLSLTITKDGSHYCVTATTTCKNAQGEEVESCTSESCELSGNTELVLEPCAGMNTTIAPAEGKKWKDVYANCDNLGSPVQSQGG